ncbi:unnamed protein product [Meloidogyne enterolobii]|uniref:Uncharacterized protein n=1 Tax=Meloidogyne enterolobii TaxID=390850 RepID=A0ACB0YA70_MELEN
MSVCAMRYLKNQHRCASSIISDLFHIIITKIYDCPTCPQNTKTFQQHVNYLNFYLKISL